MYKKNQFWEFVKPTPENIEALSAFLNLDIATFRSLISTASCMTTAALHSSTPSMRVKEALGCVWSARIARVC